MDQAEIGRAGMEWYAMSLEQGLAVREKLPADLFVDCSQQELTEQPMAVLERIYNKFDLAMSEQARAGMQAHIDANPKGKHGKHQYDLASYGLTEQEVLDRFDFYISDERWPGVI